jgi:hypothetical protein
VLDLSTFLQMVARHGPASEANPLVSHLLVGEGLPFVVVTKIVALALTVAVIAVLAGRHGAAQHRMAAAVAVVAIVAGLIGGATNAHAILGGML